jgi:glucan biosynthesis protein C
MMQRLYFVQWLRVFLISLVVAHHAAQPYGPTGGAWPIDDPANAGWLGYFFSVNAAFFMGFFFLIAGYFTGSSFDRRGGAAFVRDRLVRLGIPLVFVTFFVFGPLTYILVRPPTGFADYFFRDYIGRWQIEEGHMWFVAQLLAYSLLYGLWRAVRAWSGRSRREWSPPAPGNRTILAYAVALGAVGALVRTQFPQDVWTMVLGVIPVEPAHLPQYASMFVIGIVAGRGGWFTNLPTVVGVRWFLIGLVAIACAVVLSTFQNSLPFDMGVAWGVFEAFVCVGFILGLLVFFRRYCAKPGAWLQRLDGNVYGVYIVHLFIVVALQYAILSFDWPATLKFLCVAAVGLVLSFTVAALLRTIPPVRWVV